jgi:hypothetical protein
MGRLQSGGKESSSKLKLRWTIDERIAGKSFLDADQEFRIQLQRYQFNTPLYVETRRRTAISILSLRTPDPLRTILSVVMVATLRTRVFTTSLAHATMPSEYRTGWRIVAYAPPNHATIYSE